jgi:hypothetical protein
MRCVLGLLLRLRLSGSPDRDRWLEAVAHEELINRTHGSAVGHLDLLWMTLDDVHLRSVLRSCATVTSWLDDAACRGLPPAIFEIASRNSGISGGDVKTALAVCGVCTVREECLNDALASQEKYLVAGGMTPAQRRRLVKGRTVVIEQVVLRERSA